jgi:hypothetical protein
MPGFTANAGGRPRSVIEELKSKYLNRLPELFENLFRLAAPNNPPMVQIAATKELLDRLIGKPQVTIEAVTTKVDVAALYLRAMQRANAVETTTANSLPHTWRPSSCSSGFNPRFSAPITLVVMPEECQSTPITAPKD